MKRRNSDHLQVKHPNASRPQQKSPSELSKNYYWLVAVGAVLLILVASYTAKKQSEAELKRKQDEELKRKQYAELKRKQYAELKRKQDEELKRKQDEELKRKQDEVLKKKQEYEELKRKKNYAVDVTLNPNTAHPNLILSDDKKQVKYGDIRRDLPYNPKRFYAYLNVLGNEGFSSGRFYFEVQVKDKNGWVLGVVRESVNRKEDITEAPVNGFWTLWMMNENRYIAHADPDVSLSVQVSPQKVGVFVDYKEGLVSFYEVESRSHIYSFTDQSFNEKLYPVFNPCTDGEGENSAPLIITSVKK